MPVMKLHIFGESVDMPAAWVVVTGIDNPSTLQPVVANRANRVVADGLPTCLVHDFYDGTAEPSYRCARCWKNYLELRRRDYTSRHGFRR
jgi:hypothetical protein